MMKKEISNKAYNIAFYFTQCVGIAAFILSWVFDLPYLLIITIAAIMIVVLMIKYYGLPVTHEKLPGILKSYVDFKGYLGRHYILTLAIITQPVVALIWIIVLLKGNPPEPPSTTAIVIMIILSDVFITAFAALGMIIGKRMGNKSPEL